MFQKQKLRKKIKQCQKEILVLEGKRTRSQAALVEAILTHSVPNDADVDYFNNFTRQINTVRDRMQAYQAELDRLNS